MTEKKKRGRPPGNKKVVVVDTGADVKVSHDEFHENIIGQYQKSETAYPSNWNELGKVAKLQWLTEHKK